jgi:hypothetical protein
MVRLKKFSGGTAELFRKELISFLRGPASITEKWDLIMQLAWYFLIPMIVINGFLSALIVHNLWKQSIPYLHPILPYLYTMMLIGILSVSLSVMEGKFALKFYFWSTAIYTSAMPLAGLAFIKHLFIKPIFRRTPKNGEKTSLNWVDIIIMVLLGACALLLAICLPSPFSPILIGQGAAYLSYPLYNWLDKASRIGTVARGLVYLPGICMLIGLIATWTWGRI